MEIALLGAVKPASIFILTQTSWSTGDVAP